MKPVVLLLCAWRSAGFGIGVGGLGLVCLSWMATVGLFLVEGAYWLERGEWPTHGTRMLLAILPEQTIGWLLRPSSWFGLHKVVLWFVNLQLFAMILISGTAIGFLLFGIGNAMCEDDRVARRATEWQYGRD